MDRCFNFLLGELEGVHLFTSRWSSILAARGTLKLETFWPKQLAACGYQYFYSCHVLFSVHVINYCSHACLPCLWYKHYRRGKQRFLLLLLYFYPAPILQTLRFSTCKVWRKHSQDGSSWNFQTAAKGSRIANHAWSHEHVNNLTNASNFDKCNYRLESVWNLGTP